MISMKSVLTGTGVILISKGQYKEPVNVTKTVMSNSFMTPWTVACQAPMPMIFSRQEYGNGLPLPSPEDLPTQGANSHLLHWQEDSLPPSHLRSQRDNNEVRTSHVKPDFHILCCFPRKALEGKHTSLYTEMSEWFIKDPN